MSGFVPSAFFPVGAPALSGVTPPAATSEAVASGGSVTGWTFGAFTDPDGRIASYSATLVTVTGSGSLSGSGLGPYSITGTSDGDAYTVELDALDGDGGVLATATHTVTIEGEGLAAPTYTAPSSTGDYVIGGYHVFDGTDEQIDFGRIATMERDGGDTWTISCWAKVASSGNRALLTIGDTNNYIVVYVGSGNLLRVDYRVNGALYAVFATAVVSNTWTHVAVTCDGTDLYLYGDSALKTKSVGAGSYPAGAGTWSASSKVQLGAYKTSLYFGGQIAEMAMWSTDQSANVAAIYNSRARHDLMDLATPPDLFYAPLTSYGDDPGSGGSVVERVANNDGTGVNMETADAVFSTAPTTVTSTLTKALDVATSVVTTTKVENVFSGGTGGTGSSFP